MDARTARKRQQLIENTLAGMKAIFVDDATLVMEMDPQQENRMVELLSHGVTWWSQREVRT